MSALKKRVRFTEAGNGRHSSLDETLRAKKLETPNVKKKKKKAKKTKLQGLKAEKKKLQRDLKETRQGILEDNERKASPDYTPYENRQRLARTTSDTLSKLQKLEGQISTKEKEKKAKIQGRLHTKLKKRSIRADKQHSRLIKMTTRLERMKLGEDELRAEIVREAIERDEEKVRPTSEPRVRLPRINASSDECMRQTEGKTEVSLSDLGTEGKQDYSRPSSVLSESALQLSSTEKEIVANKLAHKYDMTRDLRNAIHEHMISRSYSFSYYNIIPPYKRRKPKPQKTKQVFNRLVYEDKIGVMDFSKSFVLTSRIA
ncbi:hypothetical protein AWC38_SpisGene7211 [Stylophora pistillata]|uniref:Uncharacterized protein n=1 Tax=Stylophora pistillata TaxID=50429 RepID=A0A2B4SHV2_STYPI|nr:hypothetical protein AWC38_SpisGene7211 [Stylophora pistillata]